MAYAFSSASSQYLEAPSSPVSAYPVTLAVWFYANNNTATEAIFAVDTDGGDSRLQLVRNGAQLIAQSISFTTSQNAVANGTYSANAWFHAAGVFGSATSRVAYLNGSAGTLLTANVAVSGMNRVTIGSRRTSSGLGVYFNGRVAEVGIWNVALTAGEIASLAKGFTCDKIRPESLVFYAPLVRDIIDVRGGLAITNNNSATVANHPRVYT